MQINGWKLTTNLKIFIGYCANLASRDTYFKIQRKGLDLPKSDKSNRKSSPERRSIAGQLRGKTMETKYQIVNGGGCKQ